jgi:hypothetical protein
MINECEAVGGMRTGNWNRSARRKPAPEPPCPHIPRGLAWNGTATAEKRNHRSCGTPLSPFSLHYSLLMLPLLSVSGSTVLLLDLHHFLSFLILYTVGRTSSTGDQPVARPLPTHRINTNRHPCLKWNSNPRSQLLSDRRQFMT